MASIEFRLLGGFTAQAGDRPPIDISKQQSGMLLAHLLMPPGRSRDRVEICSDLWPDEEPEEARHRLRNSLYGLRLILERSPVPEGGLFISTRNSIRIAPDLIRTDVAAFETAATAVISIRTPADRIAAIELAAPLYTGTLLPGIFTELVVSERDRLIALRRRLYASLSESYQEARQPAQAIEAARRAVNADPCHEESHVRLMELYAASGRASAVMQQFEALQRVYMEEFDAPPSDEACERALALWERATTVRSTPRRAVDLSEVSSHAHAPRGDEPARLPAAQSRRPPVRENGRRPVPVNPPRRGRRR